MDTLFEMGMEWILAMQQVGAPFLQALFEIVTFTGEERFYLLFVPVLFWMVDHRIGARVAFAFLISAYVNPILKDLWPEPRPYDLEPGISELRTPGSGMPSGHAQSSVFVWGTLAAQFGRNWFWMAAILWMFLVGLSRVYLGQHFPHQVLAGWLVGGILLALYLELGPRFESWMVHRPLSQQLAISTGGPILLALAYPHNDTVASAAVMCGFGSGFVLMQHYCPFSASGPWRQRLARTAIGLAGLLILYFGLSAIAPAEEEVAGNVYAGLRFLRYAVLGFWISLGAPWLFSQLPPLRAGDEIEPREALA